MSILEPQYQNHMATPHMTSAYMSSPKLSSSSPEIRQAYTGNYKYACVVEVVYDEGNDGPSAERTVRYVNE